MTYKGSFKPKNPSKYKGNPTNIVYRSSWELSYMMQLDSDASVLQWSSEETVIPYLSPIDSRVHRYFVDFYVKKKTDQGIVEFLVEIKPKKQTTAPAVQNKPTKRYIKEVQTWGVNEAKWKAAEKFAKSRGWDFIILTEDHLNIKAPIKKPWAQKKSIKKPWGKLK